MGSYGLPVVFIPHWNNTDGGKELDTSRCFMGRERFEELGKMLPTGLTVMGIDEKTGLLIDFATRRCTVLGRGGITLRRDKQEHYYLAGKVFNLQILGEYRSQEAGEGLPVGVWQSVLRHERQYEEIPEPPSQIIELVRKRENARARRDWKDADNLRQEITSLGWEVRDTPEGPVLEENK